MTPAQLAAQLKRRNQARTKARKTEADYAEACRKQAEVNARKEHMAAQAADKFANRATDMTNRLTAEPGYKPHKLKPKLTPLKQLERFHAGQLASTKLRIEVLRRVEAKTGVDFKQLCVWYEEIDYTRLDIYGRPWKSDRRKWLDNRMKSARKTMRNERMLMSCTLDVPVPVGGA